MCVSSFFAPPVSASSGVLEMLQLQQAQQQAAQAQQAQQQAQASIAAANLDTNSSRVAAEQQIKKASLATSFGATMKGANDNGGSVAYKTLFGS